MAKPSIPQGTRDFGAETIRKRNFILNNIKSVFEIYGFQPLETPAMENLDTLMGKYGEEGDKLIFKILKNEDLVKEIRNKPFHSFLDEYKDSLVQYGDENPEIKEKLKLLSYNPLETEDEKKEELKKFTGWFLKKYLKDTYLTKRALKYDLTIPFARYVAMNHNLLTFPFKRYQVQPVWRADRPQKGRYREFTQCDADVVGSTSLLNEVELCNIYHTVFVNMGLKDYELKINSRKILAALAELCGGSDKMIDITIAIDKLDKIGIDKVKEELLTRGLNETQIATIETYLNISGSNEEKISAAQQLFAGNETAAKGLEEIIYVNTQASNTNLSIDFTLARGLNYYTGIIFEVKAPATVKMGSIGGGGRYDDLTGLFGVPNIPGVGISFGVDRIYDVLEELNLFPDSLQSSTKALFFNMGAAESLFAFKQMQQLRAAGIACELFHEPAKMDKQFKYADKKNIPFAIIIGTQEIENKEAMVKNLATGEQQKLPLISLKEFFQ